MIPISLTTHAQDYCCCLPANQPATSASTVERQYILIHRSFVHRSRKIISYSPKLNSLDCSSFKNGSLMID